ncbi:MAG: hypothetical protein PHI98_01065 [Eubacteriales bacterium]|nr:hypothetical protein [Eubacteriales bacterium]
MKRLISKRPLSLITLLLVLCFIPFSMTFGEGDAIDVDLSTDTLGQVKAIYAKLIDEKVLSPFNGVVVTNPILKEANAFWMGNDGKISTQTYSLNITDNKLVRVSFEKSDSHNLETSTSGALEAAQGYSHGHGVDENAGGGIIDDVSADSLPSVEQKPGSEILLIQSEAGVVTGVFPGDVSISSSVTQTTFNQVAIGGNLEIADGTQLNLFGNNIVASLNGNSEYGSDALVEKKNILYNESSTLRIDTLEGEGTCSGCLRKIGADDKDGLITADCGIHRFCNQCSIFAADFHKRLSCGEHYLCQAEPSEMVNHETMATCGKHYLCSENVIQNPTLHSVMGKNCGKYLCHNLSAALHTRCKYCGGSLCNGESHGDGVCGNFQSNPGGIAEGPQETDSPIL